MGCFESLSLWYAAADIENNLSQTGAHGDFHQPIVDDVPRQGEHLGPLGTFRADLGKPLRALADDGGDVGVSLHIAEQGWPAPQAFIRGEGRPGPRFSPLAHDGIDKGCLFTADKSSGPKAHLHVEIKVRPEDILAQQAHLTGLMDGDVQAPDRDGVFSPDVNVTLLCPNSIGRNGHPFQDPVGIAFEGAPVHESSRVAFIRVADDILDWVFLSPDKLPFQPGGKACTSPSPQARCLNHVDDLGGSKFRDDLTQGSVAFPGDVFFNDFRVNDAAVFQHQAALLLEKVDFSHIGNGEVRFGLMVQELLDDPSLEEVLLHQVRHIFGLDLDVEDAFRIDHHVWPEATKPEAARLYHQDLPVQPFGRQLLAQGFLELLTARGVTTSSAANKYVGAVNLHPSCLPSVTFRVHSGMIRPLTTCSTIIWRTREGSTFL